MSLVGGITNTTAPNAFVRQRYTELTRQVEQDVSQGELGDSAIAAAQARSERMLKEMRLAAGVHTSLHPDVAGRPAGMDLAMVAATRETHRLTIEHAKARLDALSTKLPARFALAAELPTATDGSWNPEDFRPRTRAEAEAFAQRMVVDVTMATARLEYLDAMRESVQFEATTLGSSAARTTLAQLDAEITAQQSIVDRIAMIVDTSSDGTLTDAGIAAAYGRSVRGELDVAGARLSRSLRARGMSEGAITRILGAGELAAEEVQAPAGSQRLAAASTATASYTWTHRDNLKAARADDGRRIEARRQERVRQEEHRQAERREERRAERQRLEERATERRLERRAFEARYGYRQWAEREAAERRAAFRAWLQQLAARAGEPVFS